MSGDYFSSERYQQTISYSQVSDLKERVTELEAQIETLVNTIDTHNVLIRNYEFIKRRTSR
jgi:tetrahydromethanopterin S-methyltransferase subunit B